MGTEKSGISPLWKIIGIAVLVVLAIAAIIKVVILAAKILFFLVCVLAVSVPVAVIYLIYKMIKRK